MDLTKFVHDAKTADKSADNRVKDTLSALQKNEKSLTRVAAQLNDEVLTKLDAAKFPVHVAYCLFIQATRQHADRFEADPFFLYTRQLLLQAPIEDMANMASIVLPVAMKFADIAHARNAGKHALSSLLRALPAVTPSPNCLTPLHTAFVKLAVLARQYSVAVRVLRTPVLELDQAAARITALDLLLYFYYGSMAFIGMKLWDDALEFLKTAITVPAEAISAVVVESYKKYVLVSLMAHGKLLELPISTTPLVKRGLPTLCTEYQRISEAYATYDPAALQAVLTDVVEVLDADHNKGLAMQLVQRLMQDRIKRLTHVFVTISLADVAKHVGLADAAAAEREVVAMVAAGAITARIDQSKGMVEFTQETTRYEDPDTVKALAEAIDATMRLGDRLRKLDEKVSLSAPYLRKAVERNPSLAFAGGRGSGAGAGAGDGSGAGVPS